MALQPPAYETGAFGDLPVLDAVAVALDEGGVTLFAVNWDQATPVALDVEMRSLPSLSAASHGAISGGNPDAVNTLSSPDRVVPKTLDDPNLDGGRLQAVLPPLSWNMIRLRWQRPARRVHVVLIGVAAGGEPVHMRDGRSPAARRQHHRGCADRRRDPQASVAVDADRARVAAVPGGGRVPGRAPGARLRLLRPQNATDEPSLVRRRAEIGGQVVQPP